MKALRFAAALALAGLLGACSLTRVAYDNAPPILAWMVDDYFDLTSDQRGWVQERLARAMAWHRSQELPEYRQLLESAVVRAGKGITAADARWAYQSVRSYYHRAAERLLPDMAEFLGRLDAEQAATLERKFSEGNGKLENDLKKAPQKDRNARRAERYIDRLEDWTGRLSASQRDFVATEVAKIEELTEERLADRRKRQAQLLALIRGRASQEANVAGLRRLLIDTQQWRDPEYTRKLDERDERIYAMIAALDATLSAPQRERVQKRMRGYLEDVGALLASR